MKKKYAAAPCDICKNRVYFQEDSSMLRSIATKDLTMVVSRSPRHIRCDPTVAQYIMHTSFSPVQEPRKKFDKRLKSFQQTALRERVFTRSWIALQKQVGVEISDDLN